ncbi:hypothetical protein CDIK_1641 [Cucumispora dikerogammari]|nr:hypothetical protein CDIK_1641 [Cucumispora dikerogammari]
MLTLFFVNVFLIKDTRRSILQHLDLKNSATLYSPCIIHNTCLNSDIIAFNKFPTLVSYGAASGMFNLTLLYWSFVVNNSYNTFIISMFIFSEFVFSEEIVLALLGLRSVSHINQLINLKFDVQ